MKHLPLYMALLFATPMAMAQVDDKMAQEAACDAQELQALVNYYRTHHELIKGIKDAESAKRQLQRIEELFTKHSELLQSTTLHNEAQNACDISPEQEEAERNRLISAHCYGNTKLAEHLFDRKAAALPPQELPPHIIERLNNRVHTSKLPEVQGLQGGPGFTAETAWQPGNTYFSGELRTLEPVSFVILTNRCDDDEVLYYQANLISYYSIDEHLFLNGKPHIKKTSFLCDKTDNESPTHYKYVQWFDLSRMLPYSAEEIQRRADKAEMDYKLAANILQGVTDATSAEAAADKLAPIMDELRTNLPCVSWVVSQTPERTFEEQLELHDELQRLLFLEQTTCYGSAALHRVLCPDAIDYKDRCHLESQALLRELQVFRSIQDKASADASVTPLTNAYEEWMQTTHIQALACSDTEKESAQEAVKAELGFNEDLYEAIAFEKARLHRAHYFGSIALAEYLTKNPANALQPQPAPPHIIQMYTEEKYRDLRKDGLISGGDGTSEATAWQVALSPADAVKYHILHHREFAGKQVMKFRPLEHDFEYQRIISRKKANGKSYIRHVIILVSEDYSTAYRFEQYFELQPE